ncbi:MAG: monovalent cation/H(+) antiporter subunit G [Coxiellaceae bacterium]|nr:monovalent cation/H(+) antiporter subunit G [Coxiellaceae bacterium]
MSNSWIGGIAMFTGSLLILIASIGVLRMPDLLMRMHAATKAGTLGVTLILLGVAFYFQRWQVSTEALLTIIFIFITAPIASHLLARAAYFGGIKLANITIIDELKKTQDRELS